MADIRTMVGRRFRVRVTDSHPSWRDLGLAYDNMVGKVEYIGQPANMPNCPVVNFDTTGKYKLIAIPADWLE